MGLVPQGRRLRAPKSTLGLLNFVRQREPGGGTVAEQGPFLSFSVVLHLLGEA